MLSWFLRPRTAVCCSPCPGMTAVVVGTTDIPRPKAESEPRPLEEEIDFILKTASLYMDPAPKHSDIVSVFAGQRPLAAPKKEGQEL